MTSAASRHALIAHFNGFPEGLKKYFEHLPALARGFPWEVPLTYQFARVELAHRRTLYCGAVKVHRADPELAWTAVRNQHITRKSFPGLFALILEHDLDPAIGSLIAGAESIRDDVMHGKNVDEAKMRNAVAQVLDYSHAYNEFVDSKVRFRPFGDLRGFSGRARKYNQSTSRVLLRGLGLGLA